MKLLMCYRDKLHDCQGCLITAKAIKKHILNSPVPYIIYLYLKEEMFSCNSFVVQDLLTKIYQYRSDCRQNVVYCAMEYSRRSGIYAYRLKHKILDIG